MQASPETNSCSPAEEPISSMDSSNDEVSGFDIAFGEIQQIQETQEHLKKSLDVLKIKHQREHMVILEILEEDKIRYDGLKQELADLTELHEKEIWNLKEELISTKDKIHSTYHERKEFHEAIEACHSRLLDLERQQQQQLYMERDEDTIPRRVLGKIIGMLLAVLTSILVFVSMASQYVILLKPSGRMLCGLFLGAILYFIWKYMEVVSKYNPCPAFAAS